MLYRHRPLALAGGGGKSEDSSKLTVTHVVHLRHDVERGSQDEGEVEADVEASRGRRGRRYRSQARSPFSPYERGREKERESCRRRAPSFLRLWQSSRRKSDSSPLASMRTCRRSERRIVGKWRRRDGAGERRGPGRSEKEGGERRCRRGVVGGWIIRSVATIPASGLRRNVNNAAKLSGRPRVLIHRRACIVMWL